MKVESKVILQVEEHFDSVEMAIPKPVGYLQNADRTLLHHEVYDARHPLAAYNLSITAVCTRLVSLMETLGELTESEPFREIKNLNWDLPLVDAIDHVLDSMMEHMDVCNGIIRSLYLPSEETAYKVAIRDFKRLVEPYRRDIGLIVNHLKHAQGQIRIVAFVWPEGSSLGYFIEAPMPGGGVGPHPELHPNRDTAFSLSRDIRFHICNLFGIGVRLATILRDWIPGPPANSAVQPASEPVTKLQQALTLCSQLPDVFYPDEVMLPMPFVAIKGGNLLVEFPARFTRPHRLPATARLSVFFGGDGVTQTYGIPYFRKNELPSVFRLPTGGCHATFFSIC